MVWLNIKEPGLHRFQSLVPFTKVPRWYIYLSRSEVNRLTFQRLAHIGLPFNSAKEHQDDPKGKKH